ncbi:MAG: molybdopterin converting factor subunit 1 [Alphaproteobacteria bacterium]
MMDTAKTVGNDAVTLDGRPTTDPSDRSKVDVVYFASVRETIGVGKETLNVPSEVVTLRELIVWLSARGPEYEAALSDRLGIRAAIDHVHAAPDASIQDAREIAIFPMMTGG